MYTSTKHIILILLLIVSGLIVNGRESARLYSIGSNAVWNQASSWSLSENGTSCGLTPQSNDSIIIKSSVILNMDFAVSGQGSIRVSPGALLRGSAFKFTFTNSSSFVCQGEAQLNDLSFLDNSSLIVGSSGLVTVVHSMSNRSLSPLQVNGKLNVYGILECGSNSSSQASINGVGSVSSNNFDGQGAVMSYSPSNSIPDGSILSEINWTGKISSDWNNPSNWTGDMLPGASSNIAITVSANNPVISGTGYCYNLFISPSANLVVMPSSSLSVGGKLFIDPTAKLLLKNTSMEHASLINSGLVTGKVSSEFQVAAKSSMLVATPIADAQSGVFVNMYLREFDETNAGWGEYIVPTDVQLKPMLGYELYSPYAATRYFEGVPNFGAYSQSVSSNNEGWNLIGNPYPCYIDWQSGAGSSQGWQRESIASAIYYPDASGSGNYSVYVPGTNDASINKGNRYIAPMQGFFVKARQQGVVKVNSQAIATDNAIVGTALHNSALNFKVEGNGFSDETVVRFDASSTFDFDDSFDAYKITGVESAPSLFTSISDGTQMAINTMPSLSSQLQVPIGLKCNSENEYKLTISGASNFEFRYPLTLEDVITHNFIDLRVDSTYSFNHSNLSEPMRFILHFDVISGTDEASASQPQIVMTNGSIKVFGQENSICTVEVFGMDGKRILSTKGNLSPVMMIPFMDNHGIYLVNVTTKNTSYARKIYAE